MENSYYFRHDNTSANDDKILMMRSKFGTEGYGLFWMVLETMSQRMDGYIMPPLLGGLSLGYGVTTEKLTSFMDHCVEIGLFKKDDNGFYSQRMIEHLNYRKSFVEAGIRGADIRWHDREANRGAIREGIRGVNSKGEHSKDIVEYSSNITKKEKINTITVKERKESIDITKLKLDPSKTEEKFNKWFDLYPSEFGNKKEEAYQAWIKLNPDLELACSMIAAIRNHRSSVNWHNESGRYIPNPVKWIEEKQWLKYYNDIVKIPPVTLFFSGDKTIIN